MCRSPRLSQFYNKRIKVSCGAVWPEGRAGKARKVLPYEPQVHGADKRAHHQELFGGGGDQSHRLLQTDAEDHRDSRRYRHNIRIYKYI